MACSRAKSSKCSMTPSGPPSGWLQGEPGALSYAGAGGGVGGLAEGLAGSALKGHPGIYSPAWGSELEPMGAQTLQMVLRGCCCQVQVRRATEARPAPSPGLI